MFRGIYTHFSTRFAGLSLRKKYESILDDPKSTVGKRLNTIVYIAIFVGIFIIFLSSIPEIDARYSDTFFWIDFLVSSILLCEYAFRFMRNSNPGNFILSPRGIIDLLSFAPFFLGIFFAPFFGYDIFKILRVFRLLQLFDISLSSPLILGFLTTLEKYKQEYKSLFGLFLSFLLIFSTFVYFFEVGHNPEFASIPHALWWGIVTIGTVGYGDIVPITLGGKIFGSILVLLGPILLAVFSSVTILVFMDVAERTHEEAVNKKCKNCEALNHISANYCMNCGETNFDELEELHQETKKTLKKKLFFL